MDLRQLAALVAVADTGTFSAAADVLHTVQSNVSTHIARLERELGATLVDRAAGRLTEEGDVVVSRARRIQAELDALTADVAALRHDISGTTKLGVIGTTARWLVPSLLTAMTERHPQVQVTVLEGNTTALGPQLIGGQLDVALLNLPVQDPDIVTELLFEEDLVLVAPLDHPLAEAAKLTFADVVEHELLVPPRGVSIRIELDRAAAQLGTQLKTRAEVDGLRLIASLVFEGFGIAVLPSSAVPQVLRDTVRTVPVSGLARRQVALARRRRGLPSAPTRALIEVLHQVVETNAAGRPELHPVA